jgi:hypothetical protein
MRRRLVPPAQDLMVHGCRTGDLAFVVIAEDVDLSECAHGLVVVKKVTSPVQWPFARRSFIRGKWVQRGGRRGERRGSPSGRRYGPMIFGLECGGNGGK